MSKMTRTGAGPNGIAIVNYHGHELRAQKVSGGWVLSVGRSGERPALIFNSSREDAIAQAHAWADAQIQAEPLA